MTNQSLAGVESNRALTNPAAGAGRIRAMNPEDIDHVVRLHLDCFEGHLLVSLGERILRLYYGAVLAEPASVAVVLEDERGRLTGFAVGSLTIRALYLRLLKHDLASIIVATTPALFRHPFLCPRVLGALARRLVSPGEKGAATLSSFAVEPRARGVGAGTSLFRAFAAEVGRRGGAVLVWGTKASDHTARRFYARLASATGAISVRAAGGHACYRMDVGGLTLAGRGAHSA